MKAKPVFFSWEKVSKHCNYDIYKIYRCIKKGELKKFPGYSFLLNPEPLIHLPDIYLAEIVEYVAIASIRNYFDAKYLHNARLSTLFVPQECLQALTKNRLLRIVGKEIQFKYEEQYGNQIW
jgi:hypothetical protein